MIPGIWKKGVLQRNHQASFKFVVSRKEVLHDEIQILPIVQTVPSIFQEDRICRAQAHGLCVILQQETIALVGSHDKLRSDIGPSKEGAQAANNSGILGTPNMDVIELIKQPKLLSNPKTAIHDSVGNYGRDNEGKDGQEFRVREIEVLNGRL